MQDRIGPGVRALEFFGIITCHACSFSRVMFSILEHYYENDINIVLVSLKNGVFAS